MGCGHSRRQRKAGERQDCRDPVRPAETHLGAKSALHPACGKEATRSSRVSGASRCRRQSPAGPKIEGSPWTFVRKEGARMIHHRIKTAKIEAKAWRGVIVIALLLSGTAAPAIAHAQIVSASARYDRGVVAVQGATAQPRQYVRLNRFRITLSDRLGGFAFRVTQLPKTCSVRLRSSGHERRVPIRNCPLR